jgi:hypothetical protein
MFSRVRIGLAIAAAALAVGVACYTPSVPLPPPNLAALSFQPTMTAGMVVMQGMPEMQHANARFYIFNRTQKDGVINTAKPDGSFTSTPFNGVNGDNIQIYYDTPLGDRSQVVCTTLSTTAPLYSVGCQ